MVYEIYLTSTFSSKEQISVDTKYHSVHCHDTQDFAHASRHFFIVLL